MSLVKCLLATREALKNDFVIPDFRKHVAEYVKGGMDEQAATLKAVKDHLDIVERDYASVEKAVLDKWNSQRNAGNDGDAVKAARESLQKLKDELAVATGNFPDSLVVMINGKERTTFGDIKGMALHDPYTKASALDGTLEKNRFSGESSSDAEMSRMATAVLNPKDTARLEELTSTKYGPRTPLDAKEKKELKRLLRKQEMGETDYLDSTLEGRADKRAWDEFKTGSTDGGVNTPARVKDAEAKLEAFLRNRSTYLEPSADTHAELTRLIDKRAAAKAAVNATRTPEAQRAHRNAESALASADKALAAATARQSAFGALEPSVEMRAELAPLKARQAEAKVKADAEAAREPQAQLALKDAEKALDKYSNTIGSRGKTEGEFTPAEHEKYTALRRELELANNDHFASRLAPRDAEAFNKLLAERNALREDLNNRTQAGPDTPKLLTRVADMTYQLKQMREGPQKLKVRENNEGLGAMSGELAPNDVPITMAAREVGDHTTPAYTGNPRDLRIDPATGKAVKDSIRVPDMTESAATLKKDVAGDALGRGAHERPGDKSTYYDKDSKSVLLSLAGKMRLEERFQALADSGPSAGAKKVGERGLALLDKVYKMNPQDQQRLGKLADLPKKSDIPATPFEKLGGKLSTVVENNGRASNVAEIINALEKKYADVKPQSRVNDDIVSRINKGGEELSKVLRRIEGTDKVGPLTATLNHLLRQPRTEHIDRAVEVANSKVHDLLSKDPDKQYEMQLRRDEAKQTAAMLRDEAAKTGEAAKPENRTPESLREEAAWEHQYFTEESNKAYEEDVKRRAKLATPLGKVTEEYARRRMKNEEQAFEDQVVQLMKERNITHSDAEWQLNQENRVKIMKEREWQLDQENRAKKSNDAVAKDATPDHEGIAAAKAIVMKSLPTIDDAALPTVAQWGRLVQPQWVATLKAMPHAGEFRAGGLDGAMHVLRISMHALDKAGVAYHESLHGLFTYLKASGNDDIMNVLYKAADHPGTVKKMNEVFKGNPEVLKQIANSAEERVAYMYQLHSLGRLELQHAPRNIFEKLRNMIYKAMGVWTNDARAVHVMDSFRSGALKDKLGDRNALSKAVFEPGNNAVVKWAEGLAKPISGIGDALMGSGGARMRDTGLAAYKTVADLMHPQSSGKSADIGYLSAQRIERTARLNSLVKKLKGVSDEDLRGAHQALINEKDGNTPGEKQTVMAIRSHLRDMMKYFGDAGVRVTDRGEKYFPRVWDAEYISRNQQAFKDMLNKYAAQHQLNGNIENVLNNLMSRDGGEMGTVVDMPGFQNKKHRVLDFISAADAAPFVSKNLWETMNSYTAQGARRAEWARRFNDDGSGLKNLLEEAKRNGATQEQQDMATKYIRGIDGTLGDHINPTTRRLMGNTIVYQNIRLLPLGLFSSLIDPGGILVRGGTMNDAFSAFKRGIMELPLGFKKNQKEDAAYELAKYMGTIDDATLVHAIGSAYTQGMVGGTARKINDTLFKYNGMEQFNTSMRVSGTEAAVGFLARHASGEHGESSKRFLAELGYKPGEIIVKDGRLLMTPAEFMDHGMGSEEAHAAANKLRGAVNQWVDGAVLRPNASDRPVWFNDPHFMLFSHLKSFTYAFHNTILKRIGAEIKEGNYGPAMTMGAYVPMMLAADLMKGMIQGGGDQPDWKKGWGLEDYVWSASQRAGLYGVGQYPIDFLKDVHQGGIGVGALVGPTAEQIADIAMTLAGRHQFKTTAIHAMPANSLYSWLFKTPSTDPDYNE